MNGTLLDCKGQYKFLEQVNTELIKNFTIVLLGREKKYTFKQCIELAKKRKINLICLPFIEHKYLYKIVSKCRFQVSYCCFCKGDANPRSINEGIYAGLPYLVSDWVTLPTHIKNNNKLGVICKNNDPLDLNNKLKELLTLKNSDVLEFVDNKCNYNDICKNIIEEIYK